MGKRRPARCRTNLLAATMAGASRMLEVIFVLEAVFDRLRASLLDSNLLDAVIVDGDVYLGGGIIRVGSAVGIYLRHPVGADQVFTILVTIEPDLELTILSFKRTKTKGSLLVIGFRNSECIVRASVVIDKMPVRSERCAKCLFGKLFEVRRTIPISSRVIVIYCARWVVDVIRTPELLCHGQ